MNSFLIKNCDECSEEQVFVRETNRRPPVLEGVKEEGFEGETN